MNDDAEQIRETYAIFGLSIYHAQALERQLAMLLATVHGPGPRKVNRAGYDRLLETLFARTFGNLINRLKETGGISDELETRITEALHLRNWLTHSYFWDRVVELNSRAGRATMISELQRIIEQFEELDRELTVITRKSGEAHGVTDEVIKQETEQLLKRARTFDVR